MNSLSVLAICILAIVATEASDLHVLSPSNVFGHYTVGPFPKLQPEEFNVTGRVVAASPIEACESLKNAEDVAGNIAIVTEDSCSPFQKIKILERANATGMIYITFGGLHGSYYPTHGAPQDLYLPSVAISYTDGHKILSAVQKKNSNVTVMLETPAGNPTQEWIDGWAGVLFQLSLELYTFGLLVLCCYKLYGFVVYEKGFKLSVTQTCLVLEGVSSIIRMICLIDPINFHGIYSHFGTNFLANLSTPFTLTSTLLMAFYWMEMLTSWSRNAGRILANVSKMKIPFAITVTVLFALTVIGGAITGAGVSQLSAVTTLTTGATFIVSVAVVLFFGINGFRILRTLAAVSTEEKANNRWKRLSRITMLLIATGAAFLVFAIFLLTLISPMAQERPEPTLASWWILFFMLTTIGFSQVAAMQVPTRQRQPERSYSYRDASEEQEHDRDDETALTDQATTRTSEP